MDGKSSSSRFYSGLAWVAALLALPLLFVVWWLLRGRPVPEPASFSPQRVQPAVRARARARPA
ncbi:MAG TPA: hypothetical protein VER33_27910, partial [Polyangiaceae bacterium]|nr:hypothetical protein [Polyangiaceae bacterium]